MSQVSGAVFLSYASEDVEAAKRIAGALRTAGIEVWFDQADLRGGDIWDRQIRTQIHDCALFLPVISATTQARSEGYFRREWRLAVDRTHDMSERVPFLVPVVIDGTGEKEADVPDAFRAVQWSRLPAGETPLAFVQRVSSLLSRASNSDSSNRLSNIPSQAVAGATPVRLARSPKWLAAAVAVLGIGYVAADKLVQSGRPRAGSPPPAVGSTMSPAAIPEKSIAVLPFVDMSEKHDQEYFSDGMAEEILDLLARLPALKVIGRTSSFQFKGKTDDLRAIGTALGVTYVVEGSVRRSGEHVRVTAQLIDTRDGTRKWTETYDRDAGDVLKVQDEIAASLVRALQLEITDPDRVRAKASPHTAEVYDLYLRGLHAMDQRNQSGWEAAIADFRRVLELDPQFVPAGERLADSFAKLADYNFIAPQIGFEQARSAANAVLKIDPNSARAHAVLANVFGQYDFHWDAADHECAVARNLAPTDPIVLRADTLNMIAKGRLDEALELADAAASADPLSAAVLHTRGHLYIRLGRVQEAETSYRRALAIAPQGAWTHYFLGVALLLEGKAGEALTELQQEPYAGARLAGLVVVYHALHRSAEAQAALARLEAEHANDNAMGVAESYAYLGQRDKAFQWLNRAYLQRDPDMSLLKGAPLLASLAADSRMKALLRRMNLPD